MSRRAASLAVCLLLPAAGAIRPAAAQSPRLPADQAARVDSVFGRFRRPGWPGCALGVIQEGSLVYARGYGLASVELGVPITPETVFDLGSVSKQFTALAIVLLAQDGRLSLDDEIQKYLPEIPRYAKPVTIRHLLHHTSGLRDYIDLLYWSGLQDESVTTDGDALDILSRQKGANFPAGAEYSYSNTGFFLLSVVVQRAGGKTLRDFAAERIFGPLGMRHTQYVNRHAMVVPGKASSYYEREDGGVDLAVANWEQTGDGAVNTTLGDLLLWDRNFYSGQVGGMAGIRELLTDATLAGGKPAEYGLGLRLGKYRGLTTVGHGGAWAGFRSQYQRFPEQRTSVITLCNVALQTPWTLTDPVADVVLAGRFPEPPAPASGAVPRPGPRDRGSSSLPLSAFAGRYHSGELWADWTITLRADSLRLKMGLAPEEAFTVTAAHRFSPGLERSFVVENDKVTGIRLTTRGVRDFLLQKVAP